MSDAARSADNRELQRSRCPYRPSGTARTPLRPAELCLFEQISVPDLSDGAHDASSMMFVAESMTGRLDEF